MNGKAIIIGSFVLAFVFVSGAIIYLNTKYRNIFWYDFTPVTQTVNTAPQEAVQQPQPEKIQTQPVDSTKLAAAAIDSLVKNDAALKDSAKATPQKVTLPKENAVAEKTKNKVPETKKVNGTTAVITEDKKIEAIAQNINKLVKTDPSYEKWIKTTGKLYESMDAKKAAKIILGYSDNIARDLLLSMRKKKAAEIVAEFKPEIAARIISLN